MKTIRPLASIAYDENVLCSKLVNIYPDYISFFAYIKHKGEGDGLSEKKDHIHVYIEPSSKINPVELKEYFYSDDGRPTTLNWRFSQFQGWFYYVLHDLDYLSSKGISRQFHYSLADIVCSDPLELDALIQDCGVPECSRLRQALMNDDSLKSMYMSGLLKPSNANGIRIISECLRDTNIKQGESRKGDYYAD